MGLQLRRGLDSERTSVVFDEGEPVWTTDTTKLYIGDGITAGGIEVGGSSYTLPIATTSTLGGVKVDGTTITINTTTGVISSVSTGSVSYTTGTFSNITVSSIATINEIRMPDNGKIWWNEPGALADEVFLTYNTTTDGIFFGNSYAFDSNSNWNSVSIGSYANGRSTESIFIGNQAGMDLSAAHNYSVMIGYRAGKGNSGDNNTIIGNIITAQGSDSETFSNTLLLGAGSDQRLRVNTSTFYINKQSILSATTQTGSTITLHKNILPDVDQTLSLGSDSQRFLKGTFHNLKVHNDLDVKFLYSSEDAELQVAGGQWFGVSTTGGIRSHSDLEGYIGWPTQRMAESHINTGTFYSEVQTNKISAQSGSTTTVVNHIVPETDSAIDLGRADKKFRSLYVSSSTIFIDGNEVSVSNGNLTVNGNVVATPNQTLNTSSSVTFAGLTVNGEITANKLTIEYTTVTTTIVETDDIIKTTNSTAAGSGVGAIVSTGGISAGSGFYTANTSTFGYATFGPNNSQVQPLNTVNDAENMLYFNNNIGGSLIFRNRQTSTTYRNFTISRNGSLILDSGASLTIGLLGAGDISVNSYFNTTTNVSGTASLRTYGSEAGFYASDSGANIATYGGNRTITFDYITDDGTINLTTITSSTFSINIPATISTTATIAGLRIGYNNDRISVPNVLSDSDNMLYENLGNAGAHIFGIKSAGGVNRSLAFDRNGRIRFWNSASIYVDSDGYITLTSAGDSGAGVGDNNGRFFISTNAFETALQANSGTNIVLKQYVSDVDVPTDLATFSSSTATFLTPVAATTATISTINASTLNLSTVARFTPIAASFPFGESTATILTIDTTVHSAARLQVCVGATSGLDSHTEKITIDILTNGVDVLNAQSGLLSTTSTGICSYSAVLSGTDILVKVELLDPVNFLGAAINGVAELVANPMVIPLLPL